MVEGEDRITPSVCWLSKVPDTDIYAVVGPGGRDVGFVRKFYRTIEKDIPGKRYVAWRRTAKTPSWRYWLKGEREPGGRYAVSADTRRQAIERLCAEVNATPPHPDTTPGAEG